MNTVYQISDCHLSDESSYENLRKALEHVANDPTCENIFWPVIFICNQNRETTRSIRGVH